MQMTDSQALAAYFRDRAAWRDAKSAEFPADEGNRRSAAALRSLAEYVEQHPDLASVHDLAPHVDEENTQLILGGTRTEREVGRYGYADDDSPTSLHHEAFLGELVPLCLEDAYDRYANEYRYGEPAGRGVPDTSGQLFYFELDAARDGVTMPAGYWRRPRIERELAEYVASLKASASRKGGDA
jgi:hypothetical protein